MNNTICQSVCPDVVNISAWSRNSIGYIAVFIAPFTILANAIVFFGLIKTKSAGSRLFVIPLCINDLIIGLVSQPLSAVYLLYNEASEYCEVRYAIQFLSYMLLPFEFFLISTMGVERLIILKYQVQEIRFRWEAVRKYVLVIGILISLAFATMSIMISLYTSHFYIFSFWILVIVVLMSVITTASYIFALQHVQKSVKKLYDRKDNTVIATRARNALRQDMTLGRSVKMIIIVHMLATSPYFFIAPLWSWQMANDSVEPVIETLLVWSFIPIYLNSIVNVFLYSYYNRPLRMYILNRVRHVFGVPVNRTVVSESQSQTNEVHDTNV